MKGAKNKYFLKANTFQMAILLQFNEQNSFTAKQLFENTGINKNYLLQMLTYLVVKPKLLKSPDKGNITENSTLELNTNYNE